MASSLRTLTAAAVFAVTVALGFTAAAQVMSHRFDPVYDDMVQQSQAFGLEMVGIRLTVAETFAAPIDTGLAVELRKMAGSDLGRFYGTLSQRNLTLALDLKAALNDVVKAVDTGASVAAPAARARTLLAGASAAVIPANLQAALSFKAAVLANVLVAEDGVSESFEDAGATGNTWKFPNGWAALNRAQVLWAALAPSVPEHRRDEGNSLMEVMKPFYEKPTARVPFPVEDSEDLEALAHQMVTVLEEATDSYLYAGRVLLRLVNHLVEALAPGCAAYAAGNEALGAEIIYAVVDQYTSEAGGLHGALSIMAPDVDDKAARFILRMVESKYLKLEGAPVNMAISPADACRGLQVALSESRKTLGG